MSDIYTLLPVVAGKIKAVGKDHHNAQQGFKFRGIDDFINAVHPVLSEHGITVLPEVIDAHRSELTTAKGSTMRHVVLRVSYTFFAPDGSSVYATVEGEAMDSGDKATSKAMSMAFKYALVQVFTIPTFDPDPDGQTAPETVPTPKPLGEKRTAAFVAKCEEVGADPDDIAAIVHDGTDGRTSDLADLLTSDVRGLADALDNFKKRKDGK